MTAGSPLKIIGAVAAVVSLLLGLNQVTGVVQNFRIHRKDYSDAMLSGMQEQERSDYGAAFRSFKRAAELDPLDREAQTREAEAAMRWLESVHAGNGQTFADVANQLLPVLDKAQAKATGPRAGDILAHIAWANFLKYREGVREGVDVDASLRAALAADPGNVYAHAISGFWILWQGGDLNAAEKHFSAALAANRVRPYVRDLQLAALTNGDSEELTRAALRVANDLRKSNETIDARNRRLIFWTAFTSRLHSRDRLISSLSALPPRDAEATYEWLDDQAPGHVKAASRAFIAANVSEIEGRRSEALAQYRALQHELRGIDLSLDSAVDAAVERLARARGADELKPSAGSTAPRTRP